MSDQKEIAVLASKSTEIPAPSENTPAPSGNSPGNSTEKPKNEKVARNSGQRKTGTLEKVRSAAARVLSEAGFSLRGRPSNCPDCANKLPAKSSCATCAGRGVIARKPPGEIGSVPPLVPAGGLPEGSPMAAAAVPAASHSSVSEIFRRSCVKSVKGFLGIIKAIVATYANAAGCRPEFTKETLAKADADPEALNDFTESLDAVMKKRNIQPENSEEWALGINTVRLLAPFGLLIAEFKGEIKRQRMTSHIDREAEKAEMRRQIEAEIRAQLKA